MVNTVKLLVEGGSERENLPMGVQVHRVVVRGQFAELDHDQRAALLAEVDEHTIFKAAFTEAGTFTYEPNLVNFQFRYEVRSSPGDDVPTPLEVGLDKARAQMAAWGFETKHVRGTATDMATMWDPSS